MPDGSVNTVRGLPATGLAPRKVRHEQILGVCAYGRVGSTGRWRTNAALARRRPRHALVDNVRSRVNQRAERYEQFAVTGIQRRAVALVPFSRLIGLSAAARG